MRLCSAGRPAGILADEIEEAIRVGFTSTEILMGLRFHLL